MRVDKNEITNIILSVIDEITKIINQIDEIKERKVKKMYPNLRAEMARKNVNMTYLAEHLGVTLGTLSLKINGKNEFSFGEAVQIKRLLGVDMALEELFEKVA